MAEMPIKLYVGKDYREPKLYSHVSLLHPFWGIAVKESSPYVRAAALQHRYSKEDFTLVERIEEADFVLMPYQYDRLKAANPAKVRAIEADARRSGKPLLIDAAGDIEHSIRVPNGIVLRVSQYRYSQKENEITLPFLAEDLLESYAGGILSIRKKGGMPSVGFAGWAKLSKRERWRVRLKELPVSLAALSDPKRGAEHKGVLFRERALRALAAHPGIETYFNIRASYSGNVATAEGSVERNRREFVENLMHSDYALIIRGDANSSVRFYEALSLGRIPLFLDTACVLPLEDHIKYGDFCVFVNWRDTDRIGEILVDFHKSVSPERFEAMQRLAREAYRNYLRIDAFSKYLAAALRARIAAYI